MVNFNREKRSSQEIDRREAKKLRLRLFRVHAESVQLPFILVWAKNKGDALDWAKQQPIDDWYEHETKPHFVQEHQAELNEHAEDLVGKTQKVPRAGG